MVKFYYFFIPKNILYFRTEQNVHVKWGGGGGGGGGNSGYKSNVQSNKQNTRDTFYHCIIL